MQQVIFNPWLRHGKISHHSDMCNTINTTQNARITYTYNILNSSSQVHCRIRMVLLLEFGKNHEAISLQSYALYRVFKKIANKSGWVSKHEKV